MLKRYLYMVLYLLSPIIPIILIYMSNPAKYSDIMRALPPMLGAVAYSWIIGQFVLAARPNFIIKYFWDDEYYGFHKIMGAAIFIAAILHCLFEIRIGLIFRPISKVGYFITALFAIFMIVAYIFMEEGKLLKTNIIKKLKRITEKYKVFEYKNLVTIHSILAVVAMITLYHILMSRAVYTVKAAYVAYFVIGCISYISLKIKRITGKFTGVNFN